MQQIKLYYKRYFEFAKYLGWILLFVFLWIRGCSDAPCIAETTVVKVPEVKGNFEAVNPKNEPLPKTSNKISNNQSKVSNSVSLEDEHYISELEKENEQLSRAYYFANDSIKKLMFEKSNQLNKFSQTFDDENIKIDVSGISRGTVESLTANYLIKEKEIKTEITKKEVKFRMLAGGSVGNSIGFKKPVFSANIGFQNKKGNILRTGFDTDKHILIGYEFSLFKIEK